MVARDGGLFQSNLWKDFQKKLGKEIFEEDLFWGVIDTVPILGRYGEVSRGPLQESLDTGTLRLSFSQAAEKHQLNLIRVEPQYESVENNLLHSGLRVKKAPLDAQPKEFLMLPLLKPGEELLAGMKSKTRYNIRLAEKKGIEVREISSQEEQEKFLELFEQTAKRKSISFHSKEYYRQCIEFFSGEHGATFVALHEGRVLAGCILAFSGTTAYYLHGASSDEGRNLMAPYLLQWKQIQFAKAKGYTEYDFGGVAIQHQEANKNWDGITRFKQGFAGGESTLLPGTYDIIFSPLRYNMYMILARVKKLFV